MSDEKSLAQLQGDAKTALSQAAAVAAVALRGMAEDLAIQYYATDDIDLKRKIFVSMAEVVDKAQPKNQAVVFAPLNFALVLDSTPQEPPKKKAAPEEPLPVIEALPEPETKPVELPKRIEIIDVEPAELSPAAVEKPTLPLFGVADE